MYLVYLCMYLFIYLFIYDIILYFHTYNQTGAWNLNIYNNTNSVYYYYCLLF